VIASAFSAILVYAQDLIPGRVGMISGLFFGFAFGMGGIGAAVLGRLADATSIIFAASARSTDWPAPGTPPQHKAKTRSLGVRVAHSGTLLVRGSSTPNS
jgi:hypothetical protein